MSRRRAAASVGSVRCVFCKLQPERDRVIGGQRPAGRDRPLEVGWGHGPARTIKRLLEEDHRGTRATSDGSTKPIGARLAAAADRLRREVGGGPSSAVVGEEEPLDRGRRTMAPADFERAVAAGRALSTDEAVALGLEVAENGIV